MKIKYKSLFCVSFAFNMLGVAFCGLYVAKKISYINVGGGGYLSNPQYSAYLSMFELNVAPVDVVFLGDSIMARARVEEFFPSVNLINRGIGSDTSEGVLNRLDEVMQRNPKKIFLMIGINDIGRKTDSARTVENVFNILRLINEHNKECEVFLMSVLPTTTVRLAAIENLNTKYKELSAIYENCTYLDLYSCFLDAKGNVNKELLSADGVHLNGLGYETCIKAINHYIYEDKQHIKCN